MHYYQHHIGDYNRDTGRLSIVEHGAYRLLMDEYYVTERPLPADKVALQRICKAMTKVEREAVEKVANMFFEVQGGVLKHKRIEKEVAVYQKQAETNRVNGKKGGRPPKQEPKNNPVGFNSVTQVVSETKPKQNPNHKPLTINHIINTPLPPSGSGEAKKSDPRHAEFMALWNDRFKAIQGHEYVFNGGKDGSALKRLLQATKLTAAELISVAEQAWAKLRDDKFAKASKQSATIHGFCTCFNEIRVEVGSRQSDQGEGLQLGWGRKYQS